MDRGVFLALVAAVLFGASAPFAKLLLHDASPQLLAGLLYLGSGVGLTAVWLRRRRASARAHEAPLTSRDVPWLTGAIVFGGVLGPLLLMVGLTRTPASSASLLLNLEGMLTALLAWFVFRENFDRRHAHGPEDPPGEPHSHRHRHEPLVHAHPHYPDIHHRHGHT